MTSHALASGSSVFKSASTLSMNTTQGPLSHTEEFDWILSTTIVVTLIALILWVFASLIHYGVRNKMWNENKNNKHVLNSAKIYTCLVILTSMCLVFFISCLVTLNIGYNENETSNTCIIIYNVNFTFYRLIFTTVGLFLWFRQRAFYANQFLNMNYNRAMKMLSFVSIFIIVGNSLFLWILFIIINVFFISSPRGCVLQEKYIPVLSDIFCYFLDLRGVLHSSCLFRFVGITFIYVAEH